MVDAINTDSVKIAYLHNTDVSRSWVFPEDSEILETSRDQILCKNIKVNYVCSIRIKCEICDINVIQELGSKIKELNRFVN